MKKLILLLSLITMLASCDYEIRQKAEPVEPKLTKEQEYQQKLKDYDVVLLFEYDSVKVYRFVDIDTGRYVYFSNANGTTQYQYRIKTHNRVSNLKKVESLNTKR